MIAPLPPQPGLPQPADPAGAKPDARGEGDAFAEILAAAAAVVPASPRIPGPPPTLEHGPAVMRVSDIETVEPVEPAQAAVHVPAQMSVEVPVQAGLTDPAGEIEAPRPDQPQPAARIFNQDGFFGSSVDAPGSETVDAGAASVAAVARTMPGVVAVPMPLQAETAIAQLQAVAAGTMPTRAVSTGVTPAATLPRVSRVRPGPLAMPPTLRPAAFETEAEAESLKPITRRFVVREPAARAAVQVAMRELEQGVHVAVRAEGLDAAERVRLHDEIAALLARHGLSARSIRISAPLRGSSSQERLK